MKIAKSILVYTEVIASLTKANLFTCRHSMHARLYMNSTPQINKRVLINKPSIQAAKINSN